MSVIMLFIASLSLWLGWYFSTNPAFAKATPREMLGLGLIIIGGLLMWATGRYLPL
jgi:hypothetical protein